VTQHHKLCGITTGVETNFAVLVGLGL